MHADHYAGTSDTAAATAVAAALATIEQLPLHVLEDVFSRLDCRSLARCSAVSRSWRQLAGPGQRAEALWREQLGREFGLTAAAAAEAAAATDDGGDVPSWPLLHPAAGPGGGATARAAAAGAGGAASGPAAGSTVPAPSVEGLRIRKEDGAAAHETFYRLVRCPLASHLAYVHRFHSALGGVRSWRVQVRLLAPPSALPHNDNNNSASGTPAAAAAAMSSRTIAAGGASSPLPSPPASGSATGATDAATAAAAAGSPAVLRSSRCRCRGAAVNPQSTWLRFRLPGWVRRVAAEQPPWEPGATGGGSGGPNPTQGSAPYLELSVLAEAGEGRCWPAMRSSPFRLPAGDRMRLLQSHVEGLYVWDDDEDADEGQHPDQGGAQQQPAGDTAGAEEATEDEDEDGSDDEGAADQDDTSRHTGQDPEWDSGAAGAAASARGAGSGAAAGAGGANAGGGSAGRTRRQLPHAARPPAGPHLAAYLHYEQLLPVWPGGGAQQEGLQLHYPPPHAAHPGYMHYAARRRQAQPPCSGARQEQLQQQLRGLSVTSLSRTAAAGAGDNTARPALAADTASAAPSPTCAETLAASPVPAAYLYLDWNRLPGVAVPSDGSGDASCGGGGWVAGCIVRLWHVSPPPPSRLSSAAGAAAAAAAGAAGGSGGADASAAGSHEEDPAALRRRAVLTADSRRGDIVLLSPPPPLPPPTPSGSGPVGTADSGVAQRFAAAWLQAFGGGASDVESHACGVDERSAGGGGGGASGSTLRGAEAAMRIEELCSGPDPLMADLALLDARGRVRLGRCGVEMWNEDDGSSAAMHFLLDQLPPQRQLLWDNRLLVSWGVGGSDEGARGAGDDDHGLRDHGEEGGAMGLGGEAGSVGAGAGSSNGGDASAAAAAGGDDVTTVTGGAAGGGGGASESSEGFGPWVRVSLQMPRRNFALLMSEPEPVG